MKRFATAFACLAVGFLSTTLKADQITYTAKVTSPSNNASFAVVVIPYYGWYPAPVDGSSTHTILYYNSSFGMIQGVGATAMVTLDHGFSPYPGQQGYGKKVINVLTASPIGIPPLSTRTIGTISLAVTNQTWFIPGLWNTQATTASFGFGGGSSPAAIDSVNWEVTY